MTTTGDLGMVNPRIFTERLLIREIRVDDFEGIHVYAADPLVWRYTPPGPNTEEGTRAYIARCLAEAAESPRHRWSFVIVRLTNGQLIGGCSITIEHRVNLQASMGLVLRRDAWGRGYGTEVIRALIEFGFANMGMHRLWATCDPENIGSERAMRNAGMSHEGLMRHDTKMPDGTWRDSKLFAIINLHDA